MKILVIIYVEMHSVYLNYDNKMPGKNKLRKFSKTRNQQYCVMALLKFK